MGQTATEEEEEMNQSNSNIIYRGLHVNNMSRDELVATINELAQQADLGTMVDCESQEPCHNTTLKELQAESPVASKDVDKCPFDYDEDQNRKYFKLAGGRIEFQTKGDGSTARLMCNKEQHSVNCLTIDSYMEHVAEQMHADIEAYADAEVGLYQQRIADLKSALEEVLIDLRAAENVLGWDCNSKAEAGEALKNDS